MLEDDFGDIIRKARTAQGLELAEVASKSGMQASTLAAYERYVGSPSPAEVFAIAEVLGLDGGKLEAIARHAFTPVPHGEAFGAFRFRSLLLAQPDGWTSNCYLLNVKESDEAMIVDPGAQAERIFAVLDELNWTPRYVALTHGHGDHVGAVADIRRRHAVRILIGRADLELAGLGEAHVLEQDESFPLGNQAVRAFNTPGHTLGGVCYAVDGGCFVGDTLFSGSVGKINVKGYYERLLRSIRDQILKLPDDTLIFPGHGPLTTVGEEKIANPFFAGE